MPLEREGVGLLRLHDEISEVNKSLNQSTEPKTKEREAGCYSRKKQLKELENKTCNKLEYDQHLEIMEERNSLQQDRPDAFMHMKEMLCGTDRLNWI